jgi:glycosyltransferase involved in cell wall biosynthesis
MTNAINQEEGVNNSDLLNPNQLKVLFFAPILNYPPKGGPELSVINAIKVLHKVCELHIVTNVSRESLESSGASSFLKSHSFNLLYAPKSISVGHAPVFMRATRFIKREIFPSLYLSLEAEFIKNYALKEGIHIFWIDRVIEHSFIIYKKIRLAFPSAIIVGDTEAVYSRFILRELPLVNNPIRWLKIFYRGRVKELQERELVKTADVVTAVSNVDMMYFRSLATNKSKIMSFSNTIDLSDFKDIAEPTTKLKLPCVILLGTFGHQNSPMDRAARWLTNTIMPLVWKRVPNLHLYIIGLNAHLTQSSLNCEHVTVVGSPSSVLPYLKKGIATLVPLKFESGTRFKIVESGAASVACISTSLGAEGLNVTDKENILIADNELDFSDAIIKVATTPLLAETLGKKLHDLVRDSYSLDTQLNEAKLILKYIQELESE